MRKRMRSQRPQRPRRLPSLPSLLITALVPLALIVLLGVTVLFWLGHEGLPRQSNVFDIAAVGLLATLLLYGLGVRVLTPARLQVSRVVGYQDHTGALLPVAPFGGVITDNITIGNTRRWSLLPVVVEASVEGATLPGHVKAIAGSVGAGKFVTLHAETAAWARGWWHLGVVRLRRSDVLGVVEESRTEAGGIVIGVLPRLIAPSRWNLPFAGRLDALRDAEQPQETLPPPLVAMGREVVGIRRMRLGEPPNRIAALATARAGGWPLLARRWDNPEVEESLAVVLDLDQAGPDAETVITVGMSLADRALRDPRARVPVAIYASGWAPMAFVAGTGAEFRADVLRAAIDLLPGGNTPADALSPTLRAALDALTPGAAVVLVTTRPASLWDPILAALAHSVAFTSVSVVAAIARPQTYTALPATNVLSIPPRLGDLRNEAELNALIAGQGGPGVARRGVTGATDKQGVVHA